MTPAGLELLKKHEGLRLLAYQDVAGVWTIGYGHTGPEVVRGLNITPERATELLLQDVQSAAAAVARRVEVALTDNQRDALTSFVYNVGEGAFARSTLLKLLNEGNYEAAAAEFPRWNKAGGKVWPGLVNRRADERKLFETPDDRPMYQPLKFPFDTVSSTTPLSEVQQPMLPFIAAALPALVQAAPALIRIFGDSPQAEKNAKAAEAVAAIATAATGASNVQEAVDKLRDPRAAEDFREQVEREWFRLSEAGGGGIGGAREFNERASAPDSTPWKMPAVWISAALLPLIYFVVWQVVKDAQFSPEVVAMVVSTIVSGVLGAMVGFFLGSSFGSQRKDEVRK